MARREPPLRVSTCKDESTALMVPYIEEQQAIGSFFSRLDDLITLHQRKRLSIVKGARVVINTINEEMSFCDYYSQWVDVYKEGAIREVTMKKYKLTQAWLRKLIPDLKLPSSIV